MIYTKMTLYQITSYPLGCIGWRGPIIGGGPIPGTIIPGCGTIPGITWYTIAGAVGATIGKPAAAIIFNLLVSGSSTSALPRERKDKGNLFTRYKYQKRLDWMFNIMFRQFFPYKLCSSSNTFHTKKKKKKKKKVIKPNKLAFQIIFIPLLEGKCMRNSIVIGI